MARTELQQNARDGRPPAGSIPEAQPLQPASFGKNFFKVEFLVGRNTSERSNDKHQLMLPFRQDQPEDESLSLDYYIATPCLAFSIRVRLDRPAKEGPCTVYVFMLTQETVPET